MIDFESMPKSSMVDFQHFTHDLATDLHSRNLKLMVALPAADYSYDYKYFGTQADAIILMNYDFHYPSSAPGPIAPPEARRRAAEPLPPAAQARRQAAGRQCGWTGPGR